MQIVICVSGSRILQETLHQPLKASAPYSSPSPVMNPVHVRDNLPVGKYPDTSPGNSNPIGHHETPPGDISS
jgi:hypothetical protein